MHFILHSQFWKRKFLYDTIPLLVHLFSAVKLFVFHKNSEKKKPANTNVYRLFHSYTVTPRVGLEPTTTRLTAARSTDWAIEDYGEAFKLPVLFWYLQNCILIVRFLLLPSGRYGSLPSTRAVCLSLCSRPFEWVVIHKPACAALFHASPTQTSSFFYIQAVSDASHPLSDRSSHS